MAIIAGVRTLLVLCHSFFLGILEFFYMHRQFMREFVFLALPVEYVTTNRSFKIIDKTQSA